MNTSNGTMDTLSTSSDTNARAHLPGLGQQQVFKYYSEWAKTGNYDMHLGPDNYHGPVICADVINKYVTDKEARIVDVAAGTGRVGEELQKHGFTVFDAVEPAEGMLEAARERGIYRNHILEPFTSQTTVLKTDSYDALTVAGGMGEGHIKCAALAEMARVVRKGGYVVIVMRENYLSEVEEYKNRLEPQMEDLEDEGLWRSIERTIVPKYSFNNNGIVYVFKVL